MSALKQEFLTPVGRLVQGSAFEGQTTDKAGKQLVNRQGQPKTIFFMAVAFPKVYPQGHPQVGQPNAEFGALYAKLVQVAHQSFPAIFPGGQQNRAFAFKVMDGDGTDDDGKSNATKEGFAGHWVVKFGSGFPPRVFYAGRYQPHEQVQDPKVLPRGYFVRISGSVEGNGDTSKPGLYVNLSMVEIAGQGPIITSGPDASGVFGAVAGQLPPGATALPVMGNGPQGFAPPNGSQPGSFAPPAGMGFPGAPPMAGAPGAMPGNFAPQPGMVVQPNTTYMAGPGAPMAPQPGFQPPGAGVAAPGYSPGNFAGASAGPAMTFPSNQPQQFAPMAPPQFAPMQPQGPQPGGQHRMTPQAHPYPYEQYIANGYTDAMLIQQGLMV